MISADQKTLAPAQSERSGRCFGQRLRNGHGWRCSGSLADLRPSAGHAPPHTSWKRPWIRGTVKQATHWHHRPVDVSVKPQWYEMLNGVWGNWSDDTGRWRFRKLQNPPGLLCFWVLEPWWRLQVKIVWLFVSCFYVKKHKVWTRSCGCLKVDSGGRRICYNSR